MRIRFRCAKALRRAGIAISRKNNILQYVDGIGNALMSDPNQCCRETVLIPPPNVAVLARAQVMPPNWESAVYRFLGDLIE